MDFFPPSLNERPRFCRSNRPFFALDVKLALGFEGEAVELVIRLVALEIEADVYAGWVVLRESLS